MSSEEGLSVTGGPGSAPSVNPRLAPRETPLPPVEELYRALAGGDRNALARAITLVESRRAEDREPALALLDRCQKEAGTAVRIGISGPPGTGKSTLIDAYGMLLVERGHRVAVLAVDPSSERSGGSILGDKTRMTRLGASPAAFIRPTPSGGTLGGVARFTRPAITLVEAAGYDMVLVETVGVGQSETAVRHMVDHFVLLTVAGTGDDLQGIKRGITEAADMLAIAKADGANRDAAEEARAVLAGAMRLLPVDESGWRPPVLALSAVEPGRLPELAQTIDRHRRHLEETGALAARRSAQAVRWLREELAARLLDGLRTSESAEAALRSLEEDVSNGTVHVWRAADDLVRRFLVP